MALKDILVQVDNSRSCRNRMEAALDLSRRHQAHLIGVYVVPRMTVPPYAEVYVPSTLYETQAEIEREQTEKARQAFEGLIAGSGVNYEWRVADDPMISSLSVHARYSDLVVIGQEDPDDPAYIPLATPDEVVLRSGRPVLVIPFIGVKNPIGQHVMIAWNGGREAVRAVNDALPLLRTAKRVDVMSINPVAPNSEQRIPSADICLHLARHGVNATAKSIQARDIEVGDMLLSRMADEGVDLLVMGAYGHSRLREFVLGGATQHILRSMTTAVLMSH